MKYFEILNMNFLEIQNNFWNSEDMKNRNNKQKKVKVKQNENIK